MIVEEDDERDRPGEEAELPPRHPTGVLAKYARLVGSAATGARVGA